MLGYRPVGGVEVTGMIPVPAGDPEERDAVELRVLSMTVSRRLVRRERKG